MGHCFQNGLPNFFFFFFFFFFLINVYQNFVRLIYSHLLSLFKKILGTWCLMAALGVHHIDIRGNVIARFLPFHIYNHEYLSATTGFMPSLYDNHQSEKERFWRNLKIVKRMFTLKLHIIVCVCVCDDTCATWQIWDCLMNVYICSNVF